MDHRIKKKSPINKNHFILLHIKSESSENYAISSVKAAWTAAASLTVRLDVTAAPLHHSRHLPVDGVEAELVLGPALRSRLLQLQLGRVGELQRLQQSRLALDQVGDRVHRQAALQGGGFFFL